ncbi:hypothetical protein [Aeromicrobium ginsengisoli]|uniref:Uncharacterized protein n=1 Tax=Aeromicrobium ginsengisoli TaxID=363867 RepID=A0A5M4FDN9_9ACTN|nr:hypothetical protein [Aeromicrobium ginsengisoli]KAA1397359.1 hypothetical protein ESP70_008195 [Aeromicrobium ginsengisoli]
MSETPTAVPVRRLGLLLVSVVILALTLTWAFLSMRAVMEVGGSCADGGPYVSAQPCPGGAGFIGIAIPVMILATFVGSFVAISLSAPNLLVPMWTFLFGSLGWNFLEYAITWPGGVDPGWLICGIVFELMALPGLVVIVMSRGAMWTSGKGASSKPDDSGLWWGIYLALGTIGAALGAWSFYSWR